MRTRTGSTDQIHTAMKLISAVNSHGGFLLLESGSLWIHRGRKVPDSLKFMVNEMSTVIIGILVEGL